MASQRSDGAIRHDLGAYLNAWYEQGVFKTYALWLGLAVVISVLAFQSERLIAVFDHPIKHVEVSGAFKNLDVSELSAALQPWVDSSFLSADLQEVKELVEGFAWVKLATVSRVWPGRLVVTIQEQVAVANWGKSSLISPTGEVFTPTTMVWNQELPTLVAPENASKAARIAMINKISELQATLLVHDLRADRLVLRSRGVWELNIASGPYIELGAEPFDQKLERAIRVYVSLATDAQMLVDSIDSRYPNGVAVSWKSLDIAGLGKNKVGLKK